MDVGVKEGLGQRCSGESKMRGKKETERHLEGEKMIR